MNIRDSLNTLFGGVQFVGRRTFLTAAVLSIAGVASGQNTLGLKLGLGGNGNQQATCFSGRIAGLSVHSPRLLFLRCPLWGQRLGERQGVGVLAAVFFVVRYHPFNQKHYLWFRPHSSQIRL